MPGTQLGTDHDKLPIVEFHALLTALNAARNGARMMSFSRENPDLIRPGMSKMNSPSLRALPITQSIPARHASFTNFTAALNAETILSQFLTMNRTASPMGPVMIANNSGQFFLIQFHTALTGSPITPQIAFHRSWNQVVFVAIRTMMAISAAIATMMIPIGLAVNATLSSHCTAVHAMVAARTAMLATRWATVAAVSAMIRPVAFSADSPNLPMA